MTEEASAGPTLSSSLRRERCRSDLIGSVWQAGAIHRGVALFLPDEDDEPPSFERMISGRIVDRSQEGVWLAEASFSR